MRSLGPGLAICFGLGTLAMVTAGFVPYAGSAAVALLLGVVIGNGLNLPAACSPGIGVAEKKVLALAIILLGLSVDLAMLQSLGPTTLAIILALVPGIIGISLLLGRFMKLPLPIAWLVGIGSAICGSSAIVATSPLITKDPKDAGIAVGVVNLLGTIGMFALPPLVALVALDDQASSIVIGGTLQAVGHVVAAGFSVNDDVGEMATVIKMGRVALLVPLVLVLGIVQTAKSPQKARGLPLPGYLVGFCIAVGLSTAAVLPSEILGGLVTARKILLATAMAGIGLKIGLRELFTQGSRALGLGLLIFMIAVATLTGIQLSH